MHEQDKYTRDQTDRLTVLTAQVASDDLKDDSSFFISYSEFHENFVDYQSSFSLATNASKNKK